MSETNSERSKSLSVPLPATPDGWVLKSGLKRTLNDAVQAVHDALINDPKLSEKYIRLLQPASDEESVEGWLGFEDVAVVNMMKDWATANNHQRVAAANGAAIRKALFGVVLNRYGMSRKQRRFTVDGKIVPPPNGDDDGRGNPGHGQ